MNTRVNNSRHRIPAKSLCNIPGLFTEEMIRDGWILRNEIIWHKPSCIPTPVKDRFTVDYEKIFFFVKSQKYDFTQQFEPYAESTFNRYKYRMSNSGKSAIFRHISGQPTGMMQTDPRGRNMRCVWRVPIEPSHEFHFAMYPTRLVKTPIKAGCPEGGIVLDPFMGSGSTAVMAQHLGRNFIGFEPNPEYIEIAKRRLAKEITREK